jgi:3-oxoacyl-[acyl-carrier-protein] synthase II
MDLKRVVVTGLGALTPLGKTVAEYWQGLTDGVNGCDFIKQFDATKFKTQTRFIWGCRSPTWD